MGQIFLRDDSFIFEKIGSGLPSSQKNDKKDCTIHLKKHCGPLFFVHWQFLSSIRRENIGEFFSFLGKSAFFQKFVFATF